MLSHEGVVEGLQRDVAAGRDVEVDEGGTGMLHQGGEALGGEPNGVFGAGRVVVVDVAGAAQVDEGQRWVGPVCEEGCEAGVRRNVVFLEAELAEVGAGRVDGG